MRIVELRWRRYRIPFRRPVATAHGEMAAREGAIVEVVTDEGVIGVGEIAPLPQFGFGNPVSFKELEASGGAVVLLLAHSRGGTGRIELRAKPNSSTPWCVDAVAHGDAA